MHLSLNSRCILILRKVGVEAVDEEEAEVPAAEEAGARVQSIAIVVNREFLLTTA